MDLAGSPLLPPFLVRLAAPDIRTVFVAGCGGGFDFVHGLLLLPELVRLGKEVVLGSYSFGDPARIGGDAPVVFDGDGALAKRVSGRSLPDAYYCPEVHVCRFLDARMPARAPHAIYAYYARAFAVPTLSRFYQQIVDQHRVDAVIIVDGGSDSLMRGDEEGLGDPVEDCVSVTTVAGLERVTLKLLLSIGLGCDRYIHVSDAASLRAVAELTQAGGFLGSLGLAPSTAAFGFYRDALEHIDAQQEFRSVLSGAIVGAVEGGFGRTTPPRLKGRVQDGGIFLWPLMSVLWAFDPVKVAARSLLSGWIRDQRSPEACHQAFMVGRASLAGGARVVENLPLHETLRGPRFR